MAFDAQQHAAVFCFIMTLSASCNCSNCLRLTTTSVYFVLRDS